MSTIDLTQELSGRMRHEDGELILHHRTPWTLYVLAGKLFYATDKTHSVRRWDRALKQHGSNWNWQTEAPHLLSSPFWECQLIDWGISQGRLSLIRAKLMIRSVVQECLFELGDSMNLKSEWHPGLKAELPSCKSIVLSTWEVQTVSNSVEKLLLQWQTFGLGHLNPNLTPVLTRSIDPEKLPISDKYLNGTFTLWDIAWRARKTIVEVGSDLKPWVEHNILELKSLPDLTFPSIGQSFSSDVSTPSKTSSTSLFPTLTQPHLLRNSH